MFEEAHGAVQLAAVVVDVVRDVLVDADDEHVQRPAQEHKVEQLLIRRVLAVAARLRITTTTGRSDYYAGSSAGGWSEVMMRGFGDLEAAVMRCLWSTDDAMTVREVRGALAPERPLAYTTVMTVLDNLHKKGWLGRELSGRAYLYRPLASREAYSAQLMAEALDASEDHPVAFIHFVETMSAEDTEALRQALRRLSRRRRRG